MDPDLKEDFLLNKNVVYLNHGSFGACPRPVFERYQALQAELEHQPVAFMRDRIMPMLEAARCELGTFLGSPAAGLAFVPNATFGVNVVARSIPFEPGDEILTTDHEYGACENTFDFICRKTGARLVRAPIDLPVGTDADIMDALWAQVTSRTRMIFLSHISSATAVTFPIRQICRQARDAGILTLIDGAHAPGQLPLNLSDLGADFYTGNCHKWMMSPKGAAFLYADPNVQDMVEPLVVSWGYSGDPTITTGSPFLDNLQWLGTNDFSAYLSVPAAIEFMTTNQWETVRAACHNLLTTCLEALTDGPGLSDIYSSREQFVQMAAVLLPRGIDAGALKTELYESYRIEIPVTSWRDRDLLRISIQGYNSERDAERLTKAVKQLVQG